MQAFRAGIGGQLAAVDCLLKPLGAALAQLRARAPARERAVEEHRQLELERKRVGEDQRLGDRGAAIGGVEVHDRRDVDRAHARVHSLVPGQVDALDGDARGVGDMACQRPRLTPDREHRAMVVRVGRYVDEPGAERGADGIDGRLVATFGDVGDGEQHAAGVLALPPPVGGGS